MHPVFRLVKDDGLLGLEDLVGDLHGGQAELLVDLLSDDGVQVVEGGQAVHEAALITGVGHHGGVHLIGLQLNIMKSPVF